MSPRAKLTKPSPPSPMIKETSFKTKSGSWVGDVECSVSSPVYIPPWKSLFPSLLSWVLHEGLAPTFVTIPWLLVIAPLLLSYLAPLHSQSTHTRPRTRKSGHKLPKRPEDSFEWCRAPTITHQQRVSTLPHPLPLRNWAQTTSHYLWSLTTTLESKCYAATTTAAHQCWQSLQDHVFGMRTQLQ
jgi:hypothetical protein